jgi:non-specific serine/threonine protein kinase
VSLAFLAPIADPALVPHIVATAVGVPERSRRSLLRTLTEVLRTRRVLLVLDNCEHLMDACAELIDALLQHCSNLTVLATSREQIGITGEVVWRVPPLSVPPSPYPPADQLSRFDAVRLFLERAVAIHPIFQVTATNAPALAELCCRLDGIPLAIELAAAWVEALSVEEIAARLDDRFHLLVSGSRTASPRQQTLRNTIEWSYDLLDPAQQKLFMALGVFEGGWSAPAAEAVCGGNGTAPESVIGLLRQLVEKSLVVVDQTPDGHRFRLLETLQAYARERMQVRGELTNLEKRHLSWCLGLVEATPPQHLDPMHIQTLAREQDNLRAALRRCIQSSDAEAGLRLGVSLWSLWYVRGMYTEGYSWLVQLLALPQWEVQPADLRARALAFAGHLAYCRGDYVAAEDLLQHALATADANGDAQGVAIALHMLGTPARGRGDLARAERLYQQARAINRKLGSRVWEAMTLGNLAMIATDRGDYVRAQSFAHEALDAYAEQGHAWGVARMRVTLGRVAVIRGEDGLARRQLEDAVAFQRELQDRQGLVWSLPTLARLAFGEGDLLRAGQLLAEGLQIAEQADDRLSLARGLEAVAALLSASDPESAAQLGGAAAALRDALDAQPTPAELRPLAEWQVKVSQRLGKMAYSVASNEGRRRSLQEAVAAAIRVATSISVQSKAGTADPAGLTPREMEVATLLADGLSNRQIGQALVISEGTARSHVQHVREKLGLKSRTQVGAALRLPNA